MLCPFLPRQQAHKPRRQRRCFCCFLLMMSLTWHVISMLTSCQVLRSVHFLCESVKFESFYPTQWANNRPRTKFRCLWVDGGGGGNRVGLGWVDMQRKFSMPSGVLVSDLNPWPRGCHGSRPCVCVRLAQSRSVQGRFRVFGVPARAASRSTGTSKCQGLASSSSSPPSSFLPSGLSTISCKWREMEQ